MANTKTKKPKEQTAADIPSGKGSDLRDQPETNAWGRAAERGFDNSFKAIGKQLKGKLNASKYNNLQGKIPDLRKYAGMNPGEQRKYHRDAKKAQREGTKKAAKAGAQFAKQAAIAAAKKNPYIRAAMEAWKHREAIVKILIGSNLFILLLILGGDDANQQQLTQQQKQASQQLVSTISCIPDKLTYIGDTSTCTIHVSYPGNADNISIVDKIFPGSAYGSSNPNGAVDISGTSVTWDAKKLGLPLTPVNLTVSVVIKSTQTNWTVFNTYAITPTNLGTASSSATPSSNTCNGKYNFNSTNPPNLLGNFGDPQCNSSKQAVGTQLANLDSTNNTSDAYNWDLLIKCESSYNPNAYNPHSASGYGAYGLFQINPTGKGTPPADDNGSVIWNQQIINATNLLKDLRNRKLHAFNYWACAPTGF